MRHARKLDFYGRRELMGYPPNAQEPSPRKGNVSWFGSAQYEKDKSHIKEAASHL